MSHDYASSKLDLLMSGSYDDTIRLSVDPEQAGYRENRQFRFFDTIDSVASTDQLVYKFTSANNIDITARVIELWSGGRSYYVYPDIPENITFTGSLASAPYVWSVNGILRDGLEAHPSSGVTVQKATGAGIFSSSDFPRNGTGVLASTGANRVSSTYSQSGERAGVGAGVSFWLVFDHLSEAGSSDTKGNFRIQWEERI